MALQPPKRGQTYGKLPITFFAVAKLQQKNDILSKKGKK